MDTTNKENEQNSANDVFNANSITNDNNENLIIKERKNSDNEDEEKINKTSSKRHKAIIDSDSDDNSDVINAVKQNDDFISECPSKSILQKPKTIFDSEISSDDEEIPKRQYETNIRKSKLKSMNGKEIQKKMSAKEAMEQRREIKSESQRMVREMNVALPYHRPKVRTLKEFLEKRPKFATAVPKETLRVPPAVALRMNREQLEIISKNISLREKEVEEYFKSESESDEENEEVIDDNQPDVLEENKEIKNSDEEVKVLNEEKPRSEIFSLLDNEKVVENNDMMLNSDQISKSHEEKLDIERTVENGTANVIILENVMVQKADNLPNNSGLPGETEVEKILEKYKVDEDTMSETVSEKKKNILEMVKEKMGDFKPKLTKTDDFIILDEDVNTLVKRFMKHTEKKAPQKHNVHMDIVNIANGKVQKETLEIAVEDETIPILEKPGERLKQLKEQLSNKIAEQRSKFWRHRVENKSEGNDVSLEGKTQEDDTDTDDDGLCKADTEDEFTELEDDEDGDELIPEDDGEMVDKEVDDKKCAFLENEAEESGRDESDSEDDKNLDADDEDEQIAIAGKKKRKLRRIVQAFENDSDDEHTNNNVKETGTDGIVKNLALDTTDTLDDLSGPTPHQKRPDHTPIKNNATQTKSELGFLTPVIQLTGLQSLTSKFLHDSPGSPFAISTTSPLRSSQSGPQKKLFADDNISDSQMLDDIAGLCSGEFISQTQKLESFRKENSTIETPTNFATSSKIKDSGVSSELFDEPVTTTQDFLEVCSGKFTQTQDLEKVPESNFITLGLRDDEIKTLDDKDAENLTQLLDSDEETINFAKKKPNRKNCISDDEDEEENQHFQQPEDIKSQNFQQPEDIESEPEEEREYEYDSEENEIDVTEERKKWKVGEFFEKEAELSESEWGSADEDEKGLDQLEWEAGDAEKLDEHKVKRDLERIHMRQILDDDTHKVKMLQELLLDDGELHGAGRERQFKWKNINNIDNTENKPNEDNGEMYLDDDNEDEQHWRKLRLEREAFLKEKQYSSQTIEVESTSQIFKLGQAAVKRSTSCTTSNNLNNKSNSPDFKMSFCLSSKKGSFLSRPEQVLARVAEFTSKTVNPTIGGAKHSRNFVFHTVQNVGLEDLEGQSNVKKRKAEEGTPAALKKLRLNVSPAIKKLQKSERVKKLFNNW